MLEIIMLWHCCEVRASYFLFFFFFKLNQSKPKHKPQGLLACPCLYGASPSHRDLPLPWQTKPGPACVSAAPQPFACTSNSQNNNQAASSPRFPQNTEQVSEMCPCRCLQAWYGKSWVCGVFITSVSHSKSISAFQSWKEISMPFMYLLKKEYLYAKEKDVTFVTWGWF